MVFSDTKYYSFSDLTDNNQLDKLKTANINSVIVINKKNESLAVQEMIHNLIEKGLGKSKEEYAIIIYEDKEIPLGRAINNPNINLVISMGVAFKNLGFKTALAPYFLYTMQKVQLILTDTGDQVNSDKNLKIKLWNAIKHFKN